MQISVAIGIVYVQSCHFVTAYHLLLGHGIRHHYDRFFFPARFSFAIILTR